MIDVDKQAGMLQRSDRELLEEMARRYPTMVFAGRDLQGRILTLFKGEVVETMGLGAIVQQAVFANHQQQAGASQTFER